MVTCGGAGASLIWALSHLARGFPMIKSLMTVMYRGFPVSAWNWCLFDSSYSIRVFFGGGGVIFKFFCGLKMTK